MVQLGFEAHNLAVFLLDSRGMLFSNVGDPGLVHLLNTLDDARVVGHDVLVVLVEGLQLVGLHLLHLD